MAEFAERSRAAPPPLAPVPMIAGGALNAAPRVQRLAATAVALNAGQAPIQCNGKDKKSNNKKQQKQKAAAKGKAKAKAKKIDKIASSVTGYDSTQHSRKDIVKAIKGGKLSKMRAGHLSADSSQKMNAGTRKTITAVTGAVKAGKAKAKAEEHKYAGSDVDNGDEEDFDLDVDYDDTGYKPPRKDDDPPPPGAAGFAGGEGITA
jgi:hypothetical protein